MAGPCYRLSGPALLHGTLVNGVVSESQRGDNTMADSRGADYPKSNQ